MNRTPVRVTKTQSVSTSGDSLTGGPQEPQTFGIPNEAPLQEEAVQAAPLVIPTMSHQMENDPDVPTLDTVQVQPNTGSASEAFAESADHSLSEMNRQQNIARMPKDVKYRDSAKAAIASWDTTLLLNKAIDAWGIEPSAPDPDFNLETSMMNARIPLTEHQRKWLRGRKDINNADVFEQYEDRLLEQQENQRTSMENPVSSMGLMLADPVYFLAGASYVAAGRAMIKTARVAALAGAAGEMGVVRLVNEVRPVETSEYVIAGLVGGATNAMFGRRTVRSLAESELKALTPTARNVERVYGESAHGAALKPVSSSEEVYQGMLRRAQDDLHALPRANTEMVPTSTGKMDTIRGAREVPQVRTEPIFKTPNSEPIVLDGVIRASSKHVNSTVRTSAASALRSILGSSEVAPLVKAIAKQMMDVSGDQLSRVKVLWGQKFAGKPNTLGTYNFNDHQMRMRTKRSQIKGEGFHANVATHEALHALSALKYESGIRNPNTVHGKIAREIKDLYDHAKAFHGKDVSPEARDHFTSYGFKNPHEFMAMLYTGDEGFLKYLSKIDLPPELATGFKPTLAGAMYDAFRRLLGLDLEQANALTKALQLTDDLIKVPDNYVFSIKGNDLVKTKVPLNQTTAELVEATTKEVDMMAEAAGLGRDTWNTLKEPKSLAGKAGDFLAWNLYKTVNKIDPEFAKTWLSDPLRTNAGNNISANRRAIRAELMEFEIKYQVALREALSAEGFKWYHYIKNPDKVRAAQDAIQKQVAEVLVDWENKAYRGITIVEGDSTIHRLAKLHDDTMRHAVKVGEKAGIFDPGLASQRGYFRRKFDLGRIDDMESRIARFFDGDLEKANKYLAGQIAKNFRDMPFDADALEKLAHALLDRAKRKGELTDLSFRGHMGLEVIAEIKDMMVRQGAKPRDVQRIGEVLEGKINQAGKTSYQKSRLDLNMSGDIVLPDGTRAKIVDLMDDNITTLMNGYLDDVSGRVAMAEHGIMNTADIDKARQAFVMKAKGESARLEAAEFFDNILNDTLGRPVGEKMTNGLRYVQAFTQMMSLRNSGFWQITEFAKIMQRYGALHGAPRVMKEIFSAFTGGATKIEKQASGRTLEAILSRNSYNDLRLRPFIDRLDDGHTMDRASRGLNGLRQAQQYVYVANGMNYIQRRQSVTAANLLVSTIEDASRGNAKAVKYLSQYGIDSDMLKDIRKQFDLHGNIVDKWDDGVWAKLRSPLATIMDEDVLRARTGEIPAIAQFSTAGKILFTFRNFVLTSHNKILASGLKNDGAKAMAVMLAYQLGLSMVATQAANLSGKGEFITDPGDWANRTISMSGGIGLLAEAFGAITGSSQQFGSPFHISIDRAYRMTNFVGGGEWAKATQTGLDALPLASLLPAWGATIKYMFED